MRINKLFLQITRFFSIVFLLGFCSLRAETIADVDAQIIVKNNEKTEYEESLKKLNQDLELSRKDGSNINQISQIQLSIQAVSDQKMRVEKIIKELSDKLIVLKMKPAEIV
jgi:hypothetical protein